MLLVFSLLVAHIKIGLELLDQHLSICQIILQVSHLLNFLFVEFNFGDVSLEVSYLLFAIFKLSLQSLNSVLMLFFNHRELIFHFLYLFVSLLELVIVSVLMRHNLLVHQNSVLRDFFLNFFFNHLLTTRNEALICFELFVFLGKSLYFSYKASIFLPESRGFFFNHDDLFFDLDLFTLV